MYINKLVVFIIIAAISSTRASAQLTPDQISSDSDVMKFVKQQTLSKDAPQWNHFYLTDGTEWKNYFNLNQEQENNLATQIPRQPWAKADINNDGKNDLIVSGYIAKDENDIATATYKILVFIAGSKKNKYDVLDLLTDKSNQFPGYFSILKMGNKNCVKLIYNNTQNFSATQSPLQTDTLQYKSFVENFINYSENLYPSAIQKVEYNVKDDEQGSYHDIVIEKMDNKYFIEFSIKQPDSRKPESRTLKIKETFFQNLDTLVRSLNFASDEIDIPNEENPNAPPVTTTINYQEGTKKIIKDADGASNYTLMAIYQIMESSMQTAINKINNRSEFWGGMLGGVVGGLL